MLLPQLLDDGLLGNDDDADNDVDDDAETQVSKTELNDSFNDNIALMS